MTTCVFVSRDLGDLLLNRVIANFFQPDERYALGIREPRWSQTAKEQARLHGDNAGIYFAQSQAAYKSGDGFEAKELSRLGKLELERKRVKDARARAEFEQKRVEEGQARERIFAGRSEIICCSRHIMMSLKRLDFSRC